MSLKFSLPKRPLTWLITGCSSGFGLTIARAVQSHGHVVIATSRNPSRSPDLVAEVESKGGKWLKLDVDDPNCAQAIEDLEASGQQVDVLVNNAGSSIHACVEQFTEEDVRRQMESLYFGPFRLIRTAVPHMRKRRFGIVVNMSSGAGLEGRESMGAYAPAKAALDGESLFSNQASILILKTARHVQSSSKGSSRVQRPCLDRLARSLRYQYDPRYHRQQESLAGRL